MLHEVVVIGKLMFGPPSWRRSNAHSVAIDLRTSGHTNPITRRSISSNANTRQQRDMQRCKQYVIVFHMSGFVAVNIAPNITKSWLGALQI